VSSNISGNFSIADTNGTIYAGTFDGDQTQIMPYNQAASGPAGVDFYTSFSNRNASSGLVNVYATLAGETYAAGMDDPSDPGTVIIDPSASPSMAGGEIPLETLSAFASLDADSRSALAASDDGLTSFRIIDLRVTSDLSNVDRKDGSNPIGSFGEGSIDITLRDNNGEDINEAEGTIFAMKRTLSE